jgi:chloride channel 3/4/5
MFQRLGLRYVLFVNKGVLQGLLTKKDVWSVVNDPAFRRDGWMSNGPLGEDDAAEEVGLLESDDGTSVATPLERRPSL